MIRAGVLVALVVTAVAWYAILPAATRRLPGVTGGQLPLRGSIHIHTRRSDGTGTVEDVAAAAARAGLTFVILTDHGDGTRKPDPPRYLQDVLCIDAVEISTTGGHLVALDLEQAPYPLGGEPRDVIDDVARMGGFSIAAHPGSPKPELRWTEWSSPFDGLEWLNGDSEWRDEPAWSLVRLLFAYPVRRAESLATVLDRPDEVLNHWDALTRTRRVVAVAAADAHARIGLSALGEPYDSAALVHAPAYEQMFKTFSIALPGVRLSGDAAGDARMVVNAIRQGHVFSSIDALAAPASLRFTAASGSMRAESGDVLPLSGPVTLRVETAGPPDAVTAIYKDGKAFRLGDGTPIEETVPAEAGVYRVEVRLPASPGNPPVPWMLSNPIYVGRTDGPAAPADPHKAAGSFADRYRDGRFPQGSIENSRQAAGRISVVPAVGGGTQLSFEYALGGRLSESPYVALVMPAGNAIASYDRLMFTARASKPMRLSVQLRMPGGKGNRWQRSVFIDQTSRVQTIYFDDLSLRGEGGTGRPQLSDIDSLLFVVDSVNTKLGSNGQVWLDSIRYGR